MVNLPLHIASGSGHRKVRTLLKLGQLTVPVHRDAVLLDVIHVVLLHADLPFLVDIGIIIFRIRAEPSGRSLVQHIYGAVTVDREQNRLFRLISRQVGDFRGQLIQVIHPLLSGEIIKFDALAVVDGGSNASHIYQAVVGAFQRDGHSVGVIVDVRVPDAGSHHIVVGRFVFDIEDLHLRSCQVHGKAVRRIILRHISRHISILDIEGVITVRIIGYRGCMYVSAAGESAYRRSRNSLPLQGSGDGRLHIGSIEIMLMDADGCRALLIVVFAVGRAVVVIAYFDFRNRLVDGKLIGLPVLRAVSGQIRAAQRKGVVAVRREGNPAGCGGLIGYPDVGAAAPAANTCGGSVRIGDIKSHLIRIKVSVGHRHGGRSGILVISSVQRIIQIPGHGDSGLRHIDFQLCDLAFRLIG